MSDNFQLDLDFDISHGTVPEGIHAAEVMDVEIKDNKAGDGKNLVLKFKITSPGNEGRQLTMYQSLKPSVAWRYTAVLSALGVDVSKGKGQISRNGLMNRKCRLLVKHEDYQGEPRAQIDNVLAPDVAQPSAPAAQATPARATRAQPVKAGANKPQAEDTKPDGEGLNPQDDSGDDKGDLPF